MNANSVHSGPPYPSPYASLGGLPNVKHDVPVLAVLIVCYLSFAATNMTIYQINNRRSHKFLPSVLLFGFCMSRIATSVLRIAWATRPHNIRIGIAAGVFVNAGILIIYIINLIFAQRILRAKKPTIGWHPAIKLAFTILYVLVGVALVVVITATVVSLYTLNVNAHRIIRDLQLWASSLLLFITIVPLVMLAVAFAPPEHRDAESFGHGSVNSKAVILTCSSLLSVLIAGFKLGTASMPPRLATNPAWYDSKVAFYFFLFVPELLILSVLTFPRVDKRFHVPNGSKKAGDYSRRTELSDEEGSVRSTHEEKFKAIQ